MGAVSLGLCDLSVTDLPLTNTWRSFELPASPINSLVLRSVLILSTLGALIFAIAITLPQYVLQGSKPTSSEPVTMPPYVPMKFQKCPLVNYPTPDPAINFSTLPAHSLTQYQVYLRGVYHRYNFSKYSKPSDFLAVNRPEHPINLVLVLNEKQIDTSYNEQVKHFAFHGKVDEIQKQMTPINIEEIGSSLETNVAAHFVLIEGAAGIGKSTLCWQLCKLWSEGKLQHEWDLVVLVELRDENTRKATRLYDLLKHPNDKIRESIAQEVQKREGEGLMIIFDGYDELSDNQYSEFSVIQQILSNRVLEKATLVVTSRPFATIGLPAQFKQNLDQHIEISGFNETDLQLYITLACKDKIEMLEDLRSFVSNRPFILSVMYNPLHCKIVTELYIQYWLDGQKKFTPNTLTELYTALVLNILRRNLPLNQSSDVEELTDLPTHVYNNLMQLAELAAKGLEARQYVFNSIPCDTLSLMVSVRQLYDVRPKKAAYMFLHLTLQEYLSALYWYHQPQQRQADIIRWQLQNSTLNWLYHTFYKFEFEESGHWPHILFLAGLTKLNSFSLELITDLRKDSEKIIGPICQLLFESQSPQKVSEVVGHYRRIKVTTTSQFDWFVIGYCIANSNNKSSWNIDYLRSPHHLQLLSDGLHYSKNIFNLDLSGLKIDMKIPDIVISPVEYSTHFSSLYPFTKAISHLSLGSDFFMHADGNECCFHVLQNLSYYCPYLKSLEINQWSFVSTKPLDIPRGTIVTIILKFPRDSVVFDSLHQYQSLSEIHLYNLDHVFK